MKSLEEQIAALSPKDYEEHCERLARTYLLIRDMQIAREKKRQIQTEESQQGEHNG